MKTYPSGMGPGRGADDVKGNAKALKSARDAHWAHIEPLYSKLQRGDKLTRYERESMDADLRQFEILDGAYKSAKARDKAQRKSQDEANAAIQGQPGELLTPDQSVSVWRERAAENGVPGAQRDVGFDNEAFWAQKLGFRRPGAEMRAMGEDTTSGAGAGSAITPQAWSTSFIDLLRPKLVLSKAGVSTMPMTTEVYNYPQWMSDVAPVYLAENASNSLDTNPQFSTVQFNTSGAFQDITLVSRQILEDTNQTGGLSALLQQTIAAKFARLIESVALYGQAGSTGNPGLVNESNVNIVWNATNGAAPTDTQDFSKAAEVVRNANAEPTAFITNPKVAGTFARLNASTYANYWPMPRDVADIPVLTTTAVSSAELHGTGTALSSFYAMDWSKMIIATRVDLNVKVLDQRYADIGQVGFWSYMRFSIRTTHPEAAVKYGGYVTT